MDSEAHGSVYTTFGACIHRRSHLCQSNVWHTDDRNYILQTLTAVQRQIVQFGLQAVEASVYLTAGGKKLNIFRTTALKFKIKIYKNTNRIIKRHEI